jgi:hypothetical protein
MKKYITGILISLLCYIGPLHAKDRPLFFCGSTANDLYRLLQQEGFSIKQFNTPETAIHTAASGDAVFIVSADYPAADPKNRITPDLLKEVTQKKLQLYIECPAAFPGLDLPGKAIATRLERGVITSNVFGETLPPMSLLGIHNCYVLPVTVEHPLMVLARVVGFDKAEYGLDSTKTYPLLFEKEKVLIATTALSNFERGRYGPAVAVKQVFTYILSRMTGNPSFVIRHWPMTVKPMYSRDAPLPADARMNSIRKGAAWFYKGRFFVNPAFKAIWDKYSVDPPTGPPVNAATPDGDGTAGIIEGHTSTINYDGSQQYRYWIRADVQGEVSMALSAAGQLFRNKDYLQRARNLVNFVLHTSNMRSGAKSDTSSAAYGLIAWATTTPSVFTFYGDDNARAILGILGAAAWQHTSEWDKEMAAAILANFRTTGREGFRGERLEEPDIIRNGWQFYQNRSLIHLSPHFESWMWALYLWLYDKTKYPPLLSKTENAIRLTMEGYPDKWRWGSSMQTQRARLILPLAWLVRVDDTPEHRRWLDDMVNELLKYQDESGAIREELGKGKGMFKALNTNADYGSDEGSLIFRNGEKVACMLYTCNFALFSLNEAAQATGNSKYKTAANKLSVFLTRIQVQSSVHNDLDGAWFRAFDYGRWDYWASNSDAGWGAWCTLSGWIQSWIVTSQILLQQHQSYWDLTKQSSIHAPAQSLIGSMLK